MVEYAPTKTGNQPMEVEPIGFADVKPFARDAMREQVSFANPDGAEWYGIRMDGRLVSFFCLVVGRKSARFKSNYTVPEMRRRGCLAAFIRFAIQRCIRARIPVLTAFCTASSVRSHVAHGAYPCGKTRNGVTFVRYTLLKRRAV